MATEPTESQEDPQQTPLTGNVVEDTRPEQFKKISASLHAERERIKAVALDWSPGFSPDVRDVRSPQLLGDTLQRMQETLPGALSTVHDVLEGLEG